MMNFFARQWIQHSVLSTGGSAVILQDSRRIQSTPITYNQADRVTVLPLEDASFTITFPARHFKLAGRGGLAG